MLPPLDSLEEQPPRSLPGQSAPPPDAQPPCFRLSPWLDRHAHPEARTFIRTEYALEVLDGEGDHPRLYRAEPGTRYAGLLDVAGEEEEGSGPEAFDNASRRDSTALTIVEVLAETGGRELPLYRVVDRMAWTGTKHTALHEQLVDLALTVWKLSALVVDATGVGAGLSSFLADQLGKGPRRVIVEPFVFSGKSKSDLGWSFVGLIDGGGSRSTPTTAPISRGSTAISWRPAPTKSCRDRSAWPAIDPRSRIVPPRCMGGPSAAIRNARHSDTSHSVQAQIMRPFCHV